MESSHQRNRVMCIYININFKTVFDEMYRAVSVFSSLYDIARVNELFFELLLLQNVLFFKVHTSL